MAPRFDPNLPGLAEGNITRVAVIDPALNFDSGFEFGNFVIDPTRPFDVRVDWELFGLIVPPWVTALGGNWDVSVYAESLGGGTEARLGTALVSALPLPPPTATPPPTPRFRYSATVNVTASSLLEHTPGSNEGGIYKLAVAVFLNSNIIIPGFPGFDMIGFSEGPIIQVENPV